MPAKPVKASGSKATRAQRRKARYAMQPAITLANKKRTLARHLRHFPEDQQAFRFCVERYRDAYANTAISQMIGKAKARAIRREREQRHTHQLIQPA